MTRWGAGRLVLGVLTVGMLAAMSMALGAQVPVRPPPPDTGARRDSTARRDSLQRLRDSLVAHGDTAALRALGDTTRFRRVIKWDPDDSMMTALLQRKGFTVTRYQGTTVIVHVTEKELELHGKPSVVTQDSITLAGDTIRYNDSTRVVVARGDTLLLRNPQQGDDDVIAHKELLYDLNTSRGVLHDVTTTYVSGDRWVVHGNVAAMQADTTDNGHSAFYARNGWLTSCVEPVPHYHFAAHELKFVTKNVMVARPVILYIADIPVFWLPFVFQDVRSGRRSGIIAPNFGVAELVRNNPNYRRIVEDFGYYFAISDYMDAQVTMDWKSDARSTATDPGWVKFNGRMRYHIRDRFINGDLGISHHALRNGSTNDQYSLRHDQDFSQRTHLSANLNYVTNTAVQGTATYNPYVALQTISSQLNFRTGRGPFSVNLGGTQQQFVRREEIRRSFPTLSVTAKPITAGKWLTWTPGLSITNSQDLHIDQVGDFGYRFIQRPGGGVDSVKIDRNTRDSGIHFDTPVQIFGFNWHNAFNITDRLQDFPSLRTIVDVNDTSKKELRVYKRTYVTNFDWETSFSLPGLSQGLWNLTPSLQFQKIDPRSGLLVRTERTGGRFVSQSLRPSMGLSISPTLYRRFPGLGPLVAIRHSITPIISFAYTPHVNISDEFLAANGDTRVGYLADHQQKTVSLGLSTIFEGKLRAKSDTGSAAQQGNKLKLLSLNFTPLSYDFERAHDTKSTGLTNTTFGYTARSDLLPGLDFGVDYSLFQGDPVSDTATFKPYRTAVRGSLSIGASSSVMRVLGRFLGFTPSDTTRSFGATQSTSAALATPSNFVAGQPIAGGVPRMSQIPSGQGWTLNLTYSSQRQRPPRGSNVLERDPNAICAPYKIDVFAYQQCISQQGSATATNGSLFPETTRGGTYFLTPPQTNAQASMNFHITEKWAAQWSTNYDFVRKQFASHIMSLQREMHDWDTIFSFTRAPNGAFAFNFYIALKAEPDIKFNYPKRDAPRGTAGLVR